MHSCTAWNKMSASKCLPFLDFGGNLLNAHTLAQNSLCACILLRAHQCLIAQLRLGCTPQVNASRIAARERALQCCQEQHCSVRPGRCNVRKRCNLRHGNEDVVA
jgi:hypothetical protein